VGRLGSTGTVCAKVIVASASDAIPTRKQFKKIGVNRFFTRGSSPAIRIHIGDCEGRAHLMPSVGNKMPLVDIGTDCTRLESYCPYRKFAGGVLVSNSLSSTCVSCAASWVNKAFFLTTEARFSTAQPRIGLRAQHKKAITPKVFASSSPGFLSRDLRGSLLYYAEGVGQHLWCN
jgi:hypothetical protein